MNRREQTTGGTDMKMQTSDYPVYTKLNACQDCYKCVRHCPVKAISVLGGKASVIQERCVACGNCVKVCPAHAKTIRNDVSRLRELLAKGGRVYASIAPSFAGYFKGVPIERLAKAVMELGFTGVSETAHGAEAVSAHVSRLFGEDPNCRLMISSCCPAVNDTIRKYLPAWTKYISPIPSPVRAHAKRLREVYGQDIAVVFFGPCAAKKNESDRGPDELDLALTFRNLDELFIDRGILVDDPELGTAELSLGPAAEGRFYAVEGGMNDTLRDGSDRIRYVSVSGLDHLMRLLSCTPPGPAVGTRPVFIEALACEGGCVNGPAMTGLGDALDTIFAMDQSAPIRVSADFNTMHCGGARYPEASALTPDPSEEQIRAALAKVGKTQKADELNCGACGYESCRAFAKALIEGKAEDAMCHTWLKQNFRRKSNALIRYIPAGVVIVDGQNCIAEANRNFAELVGATLEWNALGTLEGMTLETLLPEFSNLLESALNHGSEFERFRQPLKGRLVNLAVFPIAAGESAGMVLMDVTKTELHQSEVEEKARALIRKNVDTVQQVARLLGEHIAETEIMLSTLANHG